MRGYFTTSKGARLGSREEIKDKIIGWSNDKTDGASVFKETLQDMYASPAILTAARLTRHFASAHVKFLTAIKESRGDSLTHVFSKKEVTIDDTSFNLVPLTNIIVIGEGKEVEVKVRVFPNLIIPVVISSMYCDNEYLEAASWFHNSNTFLPLLKGIQKDMDNPKNKKWDTPSRAIQNIKKYQDISISKFLTTYTTYDSSYLSASDIRDMADELATSILPLVVYEAETLQEWINMFEKGAQSCMTTSSGYSEKWRDNYQSQVRKRLPIEQRMHPAAWYYYHPHVHGYYTKSGSSVNARCICLQRGKEQFSSSKIYGSNPTAKRKLRGWLTENNITVGSSAGTYAKTSFAIPAYKRGTAVVCPFPYLDNIKNHFQVSYDKKAKEFLWTSHTKKASNVNAHSTMGYITPQNIDVQMCAGCGTMVPTRNAVVAQDNAVFCGYGCAGDRGYVRATRSDGEGVLIRREDAYADNLQSGVWYTNKEACIALGGLPVIPTQEIPEDTADCEFSQYGHKFVYKKIRYTAHRELFVTLMHCEANTNPAISREGFNIFQTLGTTVVPTFPVSTIGGSGRFNRISGDFS